MKNFFTSLLGSLVALLLFAGGCLLLLFGIIAVFSVVGGAERPVPTLERGSYLVFNLSTNISDAPPPITLGALGGRSSTLQLRTVTRALRAAADDGRIAGLLITGDLAPSAFGSGYGALQEVNEALTDFRDSGKPVVAYLTQATTRSYYLASVATDLAIDPYGVILMPGLASEPAFFAGAFEKLGVNVQVARAGKFKSAVEPFIRRDMSEENRTELQHLLDDVWQAIRADIAGRRGLTPEEIQATVDREGLIRATAALSSRLVDRLAYRDEIFDELKARTGTEDPKDPFKQVSLENYARLAKDKLDESRVRGAKSFPFTGQGRIAVVYAEGEIVDGEGDFEQVGSTRFSRELRKLRQDDEVKAIVLRVNSPGGSASASEVIQREIRLIKRVKPIIVSMGTYAASGGYWISAYGDRIFATPSTITGSIGVFGLQFDVERLAHNLGITFDRVKTGRFADAVTIARPKTDEELAIFQDLVDWIYGEFVGKVAEARQLSREAVEEVAQGRVWSGSAALERGLVDEIGGLEAAIAFAAERAELGSDYQLTEFPRSRDLMETILEFVERSAPRQAQATGLGARITARIENEFRVLRSLNDPHGIYARLPFNFLLQ